MRFSPVRRVMVVGAVLAAFAIAGSVALAAIPTTGGTVYSCYNKTTGVMRAINYPTKRCTSAERMVALASAAVDAQACRRNVHRQLHGSLAHGDVRLQVDATATGALRDGYIESNGMGGPADSSHIHTRGTVDTVRFFTAASGAPAAEITGWECLLAARDPPGQTRSGPASTTA